MLRALLLAAPGSGKGTQGERLAEIYGVPHLATGDLLRQHVAAESPLGLAAQTYMDAGELVPDDLVNELVLHRIDGPDPLAGFVLDGFPRTLAQAEAAYEWAQANDRTFHAVVMLDVPHDEVVRRLSTRGERSGRTDDTDETIQHRLEVYERSTAPLIDFYSGRGILHRIDGLGSVAEVTERIRAALDALLPAR